MTVAFVFLELFAQAGGIQSYGQDILRSYLTLPGAPSAALLLLRDRSALPTPFDVFANLTVSACYSRSPTLSRLRLAIALALVLLRQHPSWVVIGHVKLAPLVGGLCRILGVPYCVVVYGKEVWQPLAASERRALQQAQQIWSISRYTRDRACTVQQLQPHQFQLVPCVVDGDRFTPAPARAELVQGYGLEGAQVLLTVARLWPGDRYKGVDVTIQALPAIAQRFPTVKYLVVGQGDDQLRLAALAAEQGVANRVIFAGAVPDSALPEYYRLADVYVMPSQEGFGITYLEAMACGVPVVAGDADGSADPLQDGRLGWRVPHRSSEAIAHACCEILQLLQTATADQRLQPDWLRQQTLQHFGLPRLTQHLQAWIRESNLACPAPSRLS